MTGTTYTYLVLDSSSSMSSCAEATVGAYNTALDELAKRSKELKLKTQAGLILFGASGFHTGIKRLLSPLTSATAKKLQLLHGDYRPYGNTPLYDGIGLAISELGSIPLGPEDAVLVSVFTDGYENDSRTWSGAVLSPSIRALQNSGKWTFTFAGANIDLEKMSKQLGIARGNMMLYSSTQDGMQTASYNHNHGLGNYMLARSSGASASSGFYNHEESVGAQFQINTNQYKLNVDNTAEVPV